MARLTDDQLKAILSSEIQNALGWLGGELSSQRRLAQEYYYAEQFGNEEDGRSSVVLHDVLETIEWLIPELIKIFAAGDRVVQFEPTGAEDEPFARQATDYVNHILFKDNDGFKLIYDWFKGALLFKTAELKIWWDDTPRESRETYSDVSLEAIQELMADPEVEIIEQDEVQPDFYDLVIKRTTKKGRVRIESMPPEEFLISRRAVDLDGAAFLGHRTRKTASELVEEGFDPDEVQALVTGGSEAESEYNEERVARFDIDDEFPYMGHVIDESMREAWIVEGYLRIDWNNDGIAERRQIIAGGENTYTILSNEPVDDHPFVSITPNPIPHKYHGLSQADLVMDLQLIRSTVLRQWLDNLYQLNNHRTGVNQHAVVDMDELLTNRVGGVVRFKGSPHEALYEFQNVDIGANVVPALEYLDQIKEARTGVMRHSQGLDPDSLNQTATGINLLQQAAQQRKEMIARIFAETGMRDLFRKILNLVITHQDKPRTIRLRNEWVEMSPRVWNADMDVSVQVGLGFGNRDAQAMAIGEIIQLQERVVQYQGGPQGPLVTMDNIHHGLTKFVESRGFKSAEGFFSDPEGQQVQQQEQPNPDLIKVQMEAEAEKAKLQMQAENEQQKRQLDREKAAEDLALKRQELEAETQLALARLQAELEIEQARLAAQIELDQVKARMAAAEKAASREQAMELKRVEAEMRDSRERAKPNGGG